uniref:Uncharacterized protein n=1 Tax=Zea mays TaxID=4577 RepID=C4J8G0_MAIZE|nr:unknown [Zea mays]
MSSSVETFVGPDACVEYCDQGLVAVVRPQDRLYTYYVFVLSCRPVD